MLHKIPLLALTLLLIASNSLAQSTKKNVVDEVIWVVGDAPILLSDVEEQRIAAEINGQPLKNPYGIIPEQLAIQKLFVHQAELDSIEISNADAMRYADMRLSDMIQRAGSRENLEAIFHKTIPQIREMFKEQIRNQEMMKGAREKIVSHIKVTPAEVRDYFSKLPQDSIPMVNTQVEVQILTSKPKVEREEIERIENQLQEYTRRVNEGETEFARLARMYSQDGSARNGGELGLMGRNQLVTEFANVAFSLNDPKTVSKIVRTDFGYHILQFIEKRGDKVNVRHILLKPEITAAEIERCMSRLDSIADDIRANKFSFEIGAQQLSDDIDTRNNNGIMVNQVTDEDGRLVEQKARFEMNELPLEVANVVQNLKVGEISKAFTMKNPKTGGEICAIVKLKNRVEAHRANSTEDFQILKDVVLSKRQNEVIEKWIAEKIKTTYIRISPEWRNQKFEYEGWVK